MALCTSTIGDAPVTVTVSSTAPTRSSGLIVALNEPVRTTPSRFTVLNPCSENVTVYVPGLSGSMRYWPAPSVTTVRTFSMSTGLAASTVTPGSTAPDVSRTTPAIEACARAGLAPPTRYSRNTPSNAARRRPTIVRSTIALLLYQAARTAGID